MRIKTFDTIPVSKPRMTQRDQIYKLQSPSVQRYFAYKEELLWKCKQDNFILPESGSHVIFYLPFQKQMDEKEREKLHNHGHQKSPDWDNLGKGISDAFYQDDSGIWDIHITKLWSNNPRIVIRY